MRGYKGVSIADICNDVGIGRSVFYLHVKGKEDLLYNIIFRCNERLLSRSKRAFRLAQDPRLRVRLLSRQLMRMVFEHPFEMTVWMREFNYLTHHRRCEAARLIHAYQDVWRKNFQEGEAQGIFRALSAIQMNGIFGMYLYSFCWLRTDGAMNANQTGDMFAEVTLAMAQIRNDDG